MIGMTGGNGETLQNGSAKRVWFRESSPQIRESFGRLIEDASDIISIFDSEGFVLYQSPSIETLLGHRASDQIGENIFRDSICHPDDIAAKRAFVESCLHNPGAKVSAQFRLRHADGTYREIEAVGRNLLDDPDFGGIVAYYRDVTGRTMAQRTMARLAAIIESSGDSIVSTNLDGVITSWNSAADRLYGYTEVEMLGQPLGILIPPDRREEETEIFERICRGERIEPFDSVRVSKSGRLVDVSLTISPILDGLGRIIGVSKIARDIGKWKRLEQELRAAKEEAEDANRAKDQFLAVLSHELRTPLTPVLATISYVEAMPDLPELLREEIVSIRRNVEIEARLIDDLLDATRIRRGKFQLDREPLDIHASLRAALAVCQGEVDAKGLEVAMAFRAREHHVSADPARMQQAFWNLNKNAIKFTPAQGRVQILTSNDRKGELIVQVVDSGIGIEPRFLPRIFNAFEQGDLSSQEQGGLGLGLTIARMLIELQDGHLTAASEGPSRGSTFTVTLPTIRPTVEPPTSRIVLSDPSKGRSRILLVEDNPDTLRSVARLLRLHGFSVEVASSVREALEATTLNRFDLLVCDIGLPDGSGRDVMRYARDRFGLKGIAFSGYGSDEDVHESLEAGFDHHLIKPVRIDRLIELIQETAG